jgi:exodeoxyribonuclease V alpha subunit
MGVAPDDPRRLVSAVEEALAVRFRLGHMAASVETICHLVRRVTAPWEVDPNRAIQAALAANRVVAPRANVLQTRACRFMEEELESSFSERLQRVPMDAHTGAIVKAIADVEKAEGYQLSDRQREAVHMAVSCPLSVITGGAGTGKTTVVKAILAASEARRFGLPLSEHDSFEYPQVALAGRAVRRIVEATGKEATTIARLLHQIEDGGRKIRRGLMI